MVTLTKRRVYVIRFFARPLGVFFFSCGSTCHAHVSSRPISLMELMPLMKDASKEMCAVTEVTEVVLLGAIALRRSDVPLVFESELCLLGLESRGLYP